ncbi:MAG: hypothetical protein K2M46_04130 [Lachnospiraceae bacterium]|nr:hypothetical protein [Lachnospiraceae bacterium]
MDTKTTGIVAYLTLIGFIVALVAGDKEGAKFHLNQALIIYIGAIVLGVVACIPLIGWLIAMVGEIFILVCWIMGLIAAINQE